MRETTRSPLPLRARFLVELARRLHQYGTNTQRLESAVQQVALRLELDCQILATPTWLTLSFRDPKRDDPGSRSVMLRVSPGDINLRRLSETDQIAEQVLSGELSLVDGYRRLKAMQDRPSRVRRALSLLSFGVASACVAALLKLGWLDILVAGCLGLAIGLLSWLGEFSERLRMAFEAVAALTATMLAYVVAGLIGPLAIQQVIMASLIVLLPGMSLTIAISELSTGHLVSGTARMAGAMTTLLKLAFGVVLGTQFVAMAGLYEAGQIHAPVDSWVAWSCLPFAGLSFAVLFQARFRDYPLVAASVMLGYVATWSGNQLFSMGTGTGLTTADFGVFFAGLVVTAVANFYARSANRPGALVRLPGIILLVPGSVGYRSLSFLFERDVQSGIDTALTLMIVLVSLAGGMLFGNLLIPPRRSL